MGRAQVEEREREGGEGRGGTGLARKKGGEEREREMGQVDSFFRVLQVFESDLQKFVHRPFIDLLQTCGPTKLRLIVTLSATGG